MVKTYRKGYELLHQIMVMIGSYNKMQVTKDQAVHAIGLLNSLKDMVPSTPVIASNINSIAQGIGAFSDYKEDILSEDTKSILVTAFQDLKYNVAVELYDYLSENPFDITTEKDIELYRSIVALKLLRGEIDL